MYKPLWALGRKFIGLCLSSWVQVCLVDVWNPTGLGCLKQLKKAISSNFGPLFCSYRKVTQFFNSDSPSCICSTEKTEAKAVQSPGASKKPRVTKRGRRFSKQPAESKPASSATPEPHPRGKAKSKPSLSETHDIAQLMMSSLHSWDLDPNIDCISVERLGLIKPVKPVSFGMLTRGGRLSLMLPGWYGEPKVAEKTEVPPDALLLQEALGKSPGGSSPDSNCYQSRWQLSSALTTLHLVSLVSLANTLMCMNQLSFISEEKRLALLTNASLVAAPVHTSPAVGDSGEQQDSERPGAEAFEDSQVAMNHRAHIKAGWSHVAALHCCLLAELLSGSSYKPPLLHTLARKWQDRCLEVREGRCVLRGALLGKLLEMTVRKN